ncbi:GNAT family N-acetyltransferase [Clostridium sp. YIM B02515]|uniref:GNAT family N-acetyltransferase n=1 Tax=Clostridium rhizosphaerae TaxID=2803861 RepID=A0ABS1T5H1_9CLOT|nr:GNAT family N-acetyltransferase [Clostridium rhizosphaerae]MBL4934577.1 GNAT family N-acetyltransferase [Clostridium rhizosphaerae]
MLKLVKPDKKYEKQYKDMMDEWHNFGEKIVPYSIRRLDYKNFDKYLYGFEEEKNGFLYGGIPATTLWAYDDDRDIIVGAVNIRHWLNEELLRNGGHIGDGIRPSERKKGYATKMIALALEECIKLNINRVLMVCYRDNIGSAKSIINNGGVLENEIMNEDGTIDQRYWIEL